MDERATYGTPNYLEKVQSQLRALQQQRKRLMQRLLTGQVRVRV